MTGALVDWVIAGRQSIHDRQRAVVGYELRFAAPDESRPDLYSVQGSGIISSHVVFGALNIGLDRLVGDKRIFCNADRPLLVGSTPLSLPPTRTVLEVDASVGVDDEVIAGCQRLVHVGFAIALAAFPWYEGADRIRDIASIVKIDVQAVRGARLVELISRCRKPEVELLAEKVETAAEFDELHAMGFDLFQGYALGKPTLESSRVGATSDVARLRMASTMLSETLDYGEIEEILRTEPVLMYQVLQLASLGRLGEARRTVRSLREALVQAGEWRIQSWIALLVARPSGTSVSEEVTSALARARACELLADRVGESARMGFTAGMVSSFELLVGIPADELSRTLPLSDDLREAAFGDRTPLGRIVCDVADLQSGREFPRMLSGLSLADLDEALAVAFSWALETSAVLV